MSQQGVNTQYIYSSGHTLKDWCDFEIGKLVTKLVAFEGPNITQKQCTPIRQNLSLVVRKGLLCELKPIFCSEWGTYFP